MLKIKAVIFDLDGTIADTLPLCIAAFRESIEPLIERSLSDEEIIATFGPSEEGTVKALAPDSFEEGIAGYLAAYQNLHWMCPEPFSGITTLLESLKAHDVRIAMVTGKGMHSTRISLDKFQYNKYFEHIETGSPLGPRKTEGIRQVLKQWSDLEKKQAIYVGDAPSDIEASKEVGIPVVSACWAQTADADVLKKMRPDQIFYDIPSFSKWVKATS
ncbi:HAD family hydrolase [Fulvivirgaceae bacterium BMA12]|uniref:phosphoglycolate phosphatase n=1 Tax=Agaribacillus aureus TaxID=3051825 RepID=A0ABT8LCN4_9BACT|nr:HAD family hydrolase [Fulvivirgaceae bacterium BMA12]